MQLIQKVDLKFIGFVRRVSLPFSRAALFIVFFWFGFLKLLDTSPANPLVSELLHKALPVLSFENFIIGLGLLEMAIGVLFLMPGLERMALPLLGLHMFTTFMPVVILPSITWHAFLTPTLEGQYIIKNLVIIGLALSVAAGLQPLQKHTHDA